MLSAPTKRKRNASSQLGKTPLIGLWQITVDHTEGLGLVVVFAPAEKSLSSLVTGKINIDSHRSFKSPQTSAVPHTPVLFWKKHIDFPKCPSPEGRVYSSKTVFLQTVVRRLVGLLWVLNTDTQTPLLSSTEYCLPKKIALILFNPAAFNSYKPDIK